MSSTPLDNESSLVFVADPNADIIVVSSDGVQFLVRKLYLQAASDVFDGMVSAGAGDSSEKDDRTGLPVVKLDDKASELDIFLRFIDKDQSRRNQAGDPLSLEETKTLIDIADKYGAKAAIDMIELSSLRSAVATDPPGLFGFAMSLGLIDAARDALALFQKNFIAKIHQESYVEPGDDAYRNRPYVMTSGGWPHLLTDVPSADLARIPFPIMHELEKAQTRVLLHGVKWVDEARTVKLT